MSRTSWALATLGVAAAILLIQMMQFNFQMQSGGRFLALSHEGFRTLAAQAALFVPLGLTEGVLSLRVFGRHPLFAVLVVLVDAVGLAFVCETAHHFLPERSSSVIDLTACTIGAMVGFVVLSTFQDLRRDRQS